MLVVFFVILVGVTDHFNQAIFLKNWSYKAAYCEHVQARTMYHNIAQYYYNIMFCSL